MRSFRIPGKKVVFTAVFVLLLSIASAVSALPPINTDKNGVAIKGFDTVAYFTAGRPVKGKSTFSYKWKNATWLFSSKENQVMFMKNPQKYARTTADIDPESWAIVDGLLYLNLNKRIQRRWQKDIPGNITKADRNWPGVLGR
jgi:YHS domain-containing protein